MLFFRPRTSKGTSLVSYIDVLDFQEWFSWGTFWIPGLPGVDAIKTAPLLEINRACVIPGMRSLKMVEDSWNMGHDQLGVESIHHADEETQIYKTKRQAWACSPANADFWAAKTAKTLVLTPPNLRTSSIDTRHYHHVLPRQPNHGWPLPIKIDLEPLLFFVQNPGGPFFRFCCCFILHLDPKMNWMQPATATGWASFWVW